MLIEHEADFARLIKGVLDEAKGATFELTSVAKIEEGLARLADGGFDLVLIDLSLPDGAGLANIKRLEADAPRIPVIVLGHVSDETVAIEAVHEGAQDYLVKSQLNPQLLGRAIRYAVERQSADAALLEAEEKYRGIFENIVEGIFQTSPDGHYIAANSALARIYGYGSPEELMNSVRDIARKLYVEPGRRSEFVQLMQQLDTVTDFESRIYRKDGTIIWIAENVRAVRDAQGRLLNYEGTVEDITQRKLAEEKLRDSEALYHSLVETLPQSIYRKDLEQRFTFVNQLFCQTLGRTAAEILGRTDADFYPPKQAVKYQREDRRVIETRKTFGAVEERTLPGGEKNYVQVVKTPLHDAHGNVIGLQGIFWDITEQKRAEEQIRQATAELGRSREALRKKNEEMEEDLKMAREIQQTMLPQKYPSFPRSAATTDSRFRFSHRYLPTGAVGGDYFNVLALSDTEAGVFICDVMGHGVRSALIAAMVWALVEELKPLGGDPGKLLSHLNRDLCAILKHTGSPTLTTAFYLVADAATGELRYANAGHPKPLLVSRTTGAVEALGNSGGKPNAALGLFEEGIYTTTRRPLSEGDLIMLFTDGLYEVEGRNQELYTHEMLLQAVGARTKLPAAELFDDLLAEIRRFALGQDFVDDVCLVGMEVAERK
ncbi:MAG TPA: SpoIIE family protein phosphatase [Verrucomicrobiae bacterium]|nr:SpoIIE family protein phosphatase [Verrucomicrobiae bacterium]